MPELDITRGVLSAETAKRLVKRVVKASVNFIVYVVVVVFVVCLFCETSVSSIVGETKKDCTSAKCSKSIAKCLRCEFAGGSRDWIQLGPYLFDDGRSVLQANDSMCKCYLDLQLRSHLLDYSSSRLHYKHQECLADRSTKRLVGQFMK